MAKLTSKFTFSINPKETKEFVDKLDRKFKSKEADSPADGMKKFSSNIYREVLRQYDASASVKNTRRNGRLRAAIKEQGPFLLADGTVAFNIGMNLPPYWRFVEYGIKPTDKEQTYQVLGWGKAGNLPAGMGRSFRQSTFTKHRKGALPISSGAEVVSSEVYQASKGGMRLRSRTKQDLLRIKRKLTLEFSHPGFKGHYFLRAGAIYAIQNAKEFLGRELEKSINRVKMLRAAGEL